MASCTSTSVWNLWLPRCFFRGPKRWKTLTTKSGLYSGCSRHSQISATRLPLLGCVGYFLFRLKNTHWSECGEWLVLSLVIRSFIFECCLEVVYTCRFWLFSSLAAVCWDSTSSWSTTPSFCVLQFMIYCLPNHLMLHILNCWKCCDIKQYIDLI